MPLATIEIQDEVNARFLGLPRELVKQAQGDLTYYVPGFIHMPLYRAGRWDGRIRLLSETGKTYLNLVHDVTPVFEKAGYTFEIEDHRKNWDHVIEQLRYPEKHDYADYTLDGENPVELRDYQIDAIKAALDNGQGLLEMATGSGKTLTCAVISDIYAKLGKVVVIVPNIDLALQTQATFKNVGIDAGIWYGGLKDARQVTIGTWQSLDHFPELFADVICCIVDECHQAKAKTLSEIMSGSAANVPFRFGCTGTVPREDLAKQQIKGVIGEVIFRLQAWELQKRGVLASSHVFQVALEDSKNPRYKQHPSFEEWTEQLDWMFSDKERTKFVAELLEDAANSEGNVLVLIPYKKHGKTLADLIEGSISLDGDNKPKYRREIYERFNNGEIPVLICTFGIASVGLDIPQIKVLSFVEPGKKFEKVIQTIGRGLRKAPDKDYVTILDICGDTEFSKSHAKQRRTLYKEARMTFETETVSYADS